jgi:hypothetical protein
MAAAWSRLKSTNEESAIITVLMQDYTVYVGASGNSNGIA